MFPSYSYPKPVILRLLLAALLARHRSFAADARSCADRLGPGLCLLGAKHIPSSGPYVITPNHYFRSGYASQWTALAISASVPADIHWVMTGELTFPGRWYAPFAIPVFRLALNRIARVYGFTTMPPMPPRPRDVRARAASVRGLLRHIERTQHAVIGLTPEGGDQPAGRLAMPPSGVGRFCLLLATAGLRFLPVGVYESGRTLNLNFGEAYELRLPPDLTAREKDGRAAYTVMHHIAALLPAEFRGEFS